MLLDSVIVMATIAVGILVWIKLWDGTGGDVGTYMLFGAISLPFWIASFHWQGLYRQRDDSRLIADIRRVWSAVGLGTVMFILLGWPVELYVPRGVVLVLFVLLVPALLMERQILRNITRRRRRAGRGLQTLAILGTNREAVDLAEAFEDPVLGRRVVAFITEAESSSSSLRGKPVLYSRNPAAAAAELGVSTVVIATTALDAAAPTWMLRSFLDRGIQIEMTSALTGVAHDRVSVNAIGRFPLLSVDPGHRGGWRAVAKRTFDVVIAATGLVVFSPLLLAAAIAVKLDSSGTVFFTQERLGRRGVPFRLFKFRTMHPDAERQLVDLRQHNESDGPLFKMANDPRVTRVGSLLRRTSIDELPQLWNVVRGEMSLVGPRPALPSESGMWGEELRNRLRVRPGLTGMWQVSGRSGTTFDEYERLDLFYIDNWSMLTDLGILVRTVPAVLGGRGAS